MPTNNLVTLDKTQFTAQRKDKTVDYKDYYGHLRVAERYQPVDATLTTSDTAQDLILLAPKPAAVNWFINPSFETDDISTVWTNDGAAPSHQTASPRSGVDSLLLNPDNAADDEGAYAAITKVPASTPQHDLYLHVSIYMISASVTPAGLLQITDTSGTELATSGDVALNSSTHTRLTASYKLPVGTGSSDYRVRVGGGTQHNINMSADDLQIEVRETNVVSDYINVTNSEIECAWQGVADASPSQRLGTLEVIQYFDLTFVGNTYIAFDNKAISLQTNTQAEVNASGSIFVPDGTIWSREWKTNIYSNISFVNADASPSTPRVFGSVSGRPTK